MSRQYVISLNDALEEVCLVGTTHEEVAKRCQQLKADYLKSNPSVNPVMANFHYRSVPVWIPQIQRNLF